MMCPDGCGMEKPELSGYVPEEHEHTPTVKMPFLIIGNRLDEVRERVSSNNESAAYTVELINDAIEALESAVNSHEALLERLKEMAISFHSNGNHGGHFEKCDSQVCEENKEVIAQAGVKP